MQKRQKSKKSIGVLSLITVLFLTLQLVSFAEGGTGGGNGSGSGGGGGENPLTLESIDTESDINALRTDEVIYLNFSNNVVNLNVKAANAACFSMKFDDGRPANFLAFFGDDQVDRSIRNTIQIRPYGEWKAGETYHLMIKGDLASKNGSTLGSDMEVVFTIAGSKEGQATDVQSTDSDAASVEAATEKPATEDFVTEETNESIETGKGTEADEAETVDEAMDNGNINYGLLVGAVLIIGGGYWFVKRKK
jgi:LPXTG-motif cell wall-anchored protein